jgi:hypothetical protein
LKWETDYPTDNNVCYLVNSSGIYFDRTTPLGSGATLDEWYWLRIGSELKISVTLHPVQAGEYRLIWLLNGVSGTRAQWLTTTENISSQVVEDTSCSNIQFTGENGSKCFVDWSDAGLPDNTSGKWETCFQQLQLQEDVSGDTCHARVSFGNFSLAMGQSFTLDPTVNTFNSTSTLSGYIWKTGQSYPPTTYTNVYPDADALEVGQTYYPEYPGSPDYYYNVYRSYVSFDTSSIPALAYNMNVTLKLNTLGDASVQDFLVQVWGGNQPVCNGNLTILSGIQPVYGDNLNAGSWGTGNVCVATWNTNGYPGDGVYINFTIPSNQINKIGSTQFELNSSRDGIDAPLLNYPELVEFWPSNSAENGPELEVSYCLDTVTINQETWFYRNVSSSRVVVVFFGADLLDRTYVYIRSIDYTGPVGGAEKYLDKIMFLDALVQNGFSKYTPSNNSLGWNLYLQSYYANDSTWVQDLVTWLASPQNYQHIYLFGFSGGGLVVGNEIQKDYASRISAAVMNDAPVNVSENYGGGGIWYTASTASKAKVATCFIENIDDSIVPWALAEKTYYDNAIIEKVWHNWTGDHGDLFTPNCTCLDPPYENDSVAVINWFNAVHPDINNDGAVNILDAILLSNAFLSTPGYSNWNPKADLNNDGTVNILDAILLANNFGLNYTIGSASGMSGQQSGVRTMTQGGPSVLVDPSQVTLFKGDVFKVNVNVTSVTDLQGWEFQLYWNSTALNCTNATVVTPTIWQGNTQDDGPGLQTNYNSTNGRFWWAEAANYPAPPFNGSMTIVTLTFQALQPGTTSLTLADTILGNSTAQPIACTVSSGSVNVYYGRYMRGDTQTINGLNAYKLNIPESTSSASATQSGLESAPSWGIRVFVRHSNGTETEVVLDGQTGTPKAVVSGSGLQSANTSVTQTTLQSTDSLVVRVYMGDADDGWSLIATFTTEQLQASTLQATTWTVYYSVHTTFNRLYGYSGTFYWGTTTYYSRIQNLQYA